MRIMIVDDNPMNVTVVQEMLKRAGYRDVHSAPSGMELFRLLGLNEEGQEADWQPSGDPGYDLILLDMMMPRVDGIAACRAIKQIERLRDIPIIMVTAIGDSKKLAEALDAGAIDYVTKPINKIELLARIRVALRLKEEKDWHKERDRRLREELQLAREVQTAALPLPIISDDIEIGALYCPSEELAGDLYAWYRIDEHRYGVAVIDAMGHGISSSLVCMFIASILKDAMVHIVDPKHVIEELNRRALQLQFADQLIHYYYTGIYLLVDLKQGKVEYVNAGHPPGLLIRQDGTTERLEGGSPAIGLFDDMEVTKQSVSIDEGDRLLLVTDGLIDAVDAPAFEQLNGLFTQLQELGKQLPPQEWRTPLMEDSAVLERPDDRCLVWIDIKSKNGQ
ncbi:PP2C family protein-serine/threonine phosphatase [Paenibacillus tarimensis]|uniref:PP2C family protein-serine/threonine phosphatase n=1 Tax=Paenibacillus tarimensis TaxID=416012 RepID=UPI001F315A12|nr:fused response regulator/phosphatase [Paenibacillus tarimensis]MCF2943636.1 fused response regulator/phosphatase [Paenibacillus tarimensis]